MATNPFIIQERPETMTPWQKLIRMFQMRGLQPQAEPLSTTMHNEEGNPVFGAEATTTPYPAAPETMQMPQVDPIRSPIGGTPTLPEPMGNLEFANLLGRAVVPPPDLSSHIPAVEGMRPAHPKLANWMENFIIAQSGQTPTEPFSGIRGLMDYRAKQAAAEAALPGQRLATGLGLATDLDKMREAQLAGQRAASLNESAIAENMAQAAQAQAQAGRLRNPVATPGVGSDFDAYVIRLEADKGRQLTGPELLAARKAWGEQAGAGSYTPAELQVYNTYAAQEKEAGRTPMALKDWHTSVANTYMQGRYIPTVNQQTGQITAVFPNAPERGVFTAPAGQVTPTFAGRIAEASAAFTTADSMLKEIENQSKDLFKAEGAFDVIKEGGQRALVAIPGGAAILPKVSVYQDTVTAFSSMLTRAAGERGVLTTMDVQRIINAMPKLGRDTAATAQTKLETMRRLYKAVVTGAEAAYSSGDVPTTEDFSAAGLQEGGILRDPDTGRRWVLQGGVARPIILAGE